ncbi:MAG: hypothetical protein ACI83D_000245, partial [Planctomycetota bacterium]
TVTVSSICSWRESTNILFIIIISGNKKSSLHI